jgi:hypothetical protein
MLMIDNKIIEKQFTYLTIAASLQSADFLIVGIWDGNI